MASVLKVDKLDPQSGTALEIGTSGDTVTVPTGAGLTVTDEVKTNKISPATGAAFALGDSGDTFTVPSGATIVNSGTATGFGGGKILQVLSVLVSTSFATTSTSYVDTDLYKAITPASTSNDILIHVSLPCKSYKTNESSASTAANIPVGLFLTDVSGTELADGQLAFQYTPSSSTNTYAMSGWASFVYLHSPSSTSAVTYRVGIKTFHSDWTATAFVDLSGNDCVGSMVVMEVDGT
jgi:hypothetical protein